MRYYGLKLLTKVTNKWNRNWELESTGIKATYKPSVLAGRFQETKASRFYLFGLTDWSWSREEEGIGLVAHPPGVIALETERLWSFKSIVLIVEDSIQKYLHCLQLQSDFKTTPLPNHKYYSKYYH